MTTISGKKRIAVVAPVAAVVLVLAPRAAAVQASTSTTARTNSAAAGRNTCIRVDASRSVQREPQPREVER